MSNFEKARASIDKGLTGKSHFPYRSIRLCSHVTASPACQGRYVIRRVTRVVVCRHAVRCARVSIIMGSIATKHWNGGAYSEKPPPSLATTKGGFQISACTKRQRRRDNDDDSVYGGNQGNGIGHAAVVHTRNSLRDGARARATQTVVIHIHAQKCRTVYLYKINTDWPMIVINIKI